MMTKRTNKVNFRKHLDHVITKYIEWKFRVKKLGPTMFFSGIGLITLSVATGYSLQYESQTSIGINKIIFNSSTSEFWVQITVLILGALFSIAGGYLWTRSTLEESSNEKKKRMVVSNNLKMIDCIWLIFLTDYLIFL